MKTGLGIDTGGTYTDAVLYNFETNEILCSAKSLTTKNDLSIGITDSISRLDDSLFPDIQIISLSTTLATNACIEDRGRQAKLMVIGGDRKIVSQKHSEYKLPKADDIYFIDGRISLKGDIVSEPDWNQVRNELAEIRKGINCAAVAGMLASRNPIFEVKLKKILSELGFTSVCSSDLAPDELNYLKRASTALLNARLLPIIGEFLDAVKLSIKNLGINAPVYIVRGDGSLMNEEFARQRPVDTLMCGPTSSVIGAMTLTDAENAVIVDIGGTTSDLALIRDGVPVKSEGNVKIGGWQTAVDSTYIETFGLGGDTGISLSVDMKLILETERIVPLCVLASEYPSVIPELEKMAYRRNQGRVHVYEFYQFIKDDESVSDKERRILELLKEKPMTPDDLADAVLTDIYSLNLKNLEKKGCVMRCGFTPTDVMHIKGEFQRFSRDASVLGAGYFMNLLGNISLDELCDMVMNKVCFRLYSGIVRILSHKSDIKGNDVPENILEYSFNNKNRDIYTSVSTDNLLIGVGAPTHVFLKYTAEKLGAEWVIPQNAHVANAVGAIACGVDVNYKLTIQPNENMWVVLGVKDVVSFENSDEAVEYAKAHAYEYACEIASNRGLSGERDAEYDVNYRKSIAKTDAGLISVDLDIIVSVRIKGKIFV